MKITAADLATFNAVMAHNGLDASETELCKEAYRRNPEAARATYNALAGEMALGYPVPKPADTREWVKLSQPPFVLEKKHR